MVHVLVSDCCFYATMIGWENKSLSHTRDSKKRVIKDDAERAVSSLTQFATLQSPFGMERELDLEEYN